MRGQHAGHGQAYLGEPYPRGTRRRVLDPLYLLVRSPDGGHGGQSQGQRQAERRESALAERMRAPAHLAVNTKVLTSPWLHWAWARAAR